jgi:integrase
LADKFEFWLRANLPSCGVEHVAKHLQLAKEVLKLAVKMEEIRYNPLLYLDIKRGKPKKTVFITLSELRSLEVIRFASPVLQQTADLLIFTCYTGLAYEDLKTFSAQTHLRQGMDGEQWIYKARGKTDVLAVLPLFEPARRILDKYEGKLPYLRNDHYNRYLKQVAAIAGLPVSITTHVGRKTAANLWHNEGGLTMEQVAAMLGHSDPETTRKYYVQTDPEKLLQASNRLKVLFA